MATIIVNPLEDLKKFPPDRGLADWKWEAARYGMFTGWVSGDRKAGKKVYIWCDLPRLPVTYRVFPSDQPAPNEWKPLSKGSPKGATEIFEAGRYCIQFRCSFEGDDYEFHGVTFVVPPKPPRKSPSKPGTEAPPVAEPQKHEPSQATRTPPKRKAIDTKSFAAIREARTTGGNYGLDTDTIIERLSAWQLLCTFRVQSAKPDSIEIIFDTLPEDIRAFVGDLYDLCPDLVDQGTGCVAEFIGSGAEMPPGMQKLVEGTDFDDEDYGLEILKRELQQKKQVTLWWD